MKAQRLNIKICCIQNEDEALLALSRGADALGFVSAMPSGFGPISEKKIARIISCVPEGVATFLLTSHSDSEAIIDQVHETKANTLQLCRPLSPKAIQTLHRELPEVKLVQVVHVTGREALKVAEEVAPRVDALLLDTGLLSGPVKQLGGTGRTHDWSVSREIVDRVGIPVWLAGGLRSENVGVAVRTVRPHGVDVCSGVRVDDELSEKRLDAFVRVLGWKP